MYAETAIDRLISLDRSANKFFIDLSINFTKQTYTNCLPLLFVTLFNEPFTQANNKFVIFFFHLPLLLLSINLWDFSNRRWAIRIRTLHQAGILILFDMINDFGFRCFLGNVFCTFIESIRDFNSFYVLMNFKQTMIIFGRFLVCINDLASSRTENYSRHYIL